MAKPTVLVEDFADMLGFDTPAPQADPTTLQVQGGLTEMDFSIMEAFPNHKFKMYEGQRLADMADSIKQFGILLPIILWHTEDGKYIILSGHNRRNAAMLAGLEKGPVIIKENLTHDDAILIVTETNLRQRSFGDMSHSERAYCLSQHYEALKSQGKRTDILAEIETLLNTHDTGDSDTCAQVEHKLKSRDKISDEYGLSRAKVARYIRIANLVDDLISKVDTGEIAFLAAYDLSFVEDSDKQQRIADFMEYDSYKLDMKKAELLREYYDKSALSDKTIVQILSGEKTRKPKSDKPKPVKIKPAVITKYFIAGESPKEIEDTIDKALALYFENQQNEKEAIT